MSYAQGIIYTVSHPETNEIVYVGTTFNYERRIYQHFQKSSKSKLSKWIYELDEIGLKPIFTIIDSCNYLRRFELERKWINHYFNLGCSLFNRTPAKNSDIATSEYFEIKINIKKDLLYRITEESKDKLLSEIIEGSLAEKTIQHRTFTENEIHSLQSEVHAITGNGEVMQCFNALLGVSAG